MFFQGWCEGHFDFTFLNLIHSVIGFDDNLSGECLIMEWLAFNLTLSDNKSSWLSEQPILVESIDSWSSLEKEGGHCVSVPSLNCIYLLPGLSFQLCNLSLLWVCLWFDNAGELSPLHKVWVSLWKIKNLLHGRVYLHNTLPCDEFHTLHSIGRGPEMNSCKIILKVWSELQFVKKQKFI